MSSTRDAINTQIAELCQADCYDKAAAKTLESFGGEIMRFMMSRVDNPQIASDAFSTFSEDLCRGLPQFQFNASVRTWAYTLAYRALLRTRRTLVRERSRRVSLSEVDNRSGIIARERTATPTYLRTEVKYRIRALRSRLSEKDQLLLDLRTTRRCTWKDIARILLDAADEPNTARINKEAARLRKRFQLITERLRTMAEAEGILQKRQTD